MFDIIKQISAKEAASRYIDSCENAQQIETMRKYVELYRNKFEDMIGYYQLLNLIDFKVSQIFNR